MNFIWLLTVSSMVLIIQVVKSKQIKVLNQANHVLSKMGLCIKEGYSTDLHTAAAAGNFSRVEEILLAGAKVDARDKECLTPLYRAAEHNHTSIMELLKKYGANVDIRDIYNETLLFKAIKKRDKIAVLGLLHAGSSLESSGLYEGFTPLHKAVELKDLEMVTILIAKGAEVNSFDYEDFPLLIATKSRNKAMINLLLDNGAELKPQCLWWAVIDNRKNIVLLLLQRGADPNECVLGSSPLHSAVDNGKVEMVKLLLDKGADVNSRDAERKTPLSLATFYGRIDIIKLLINSSANINAKDANENTPLHYLCDNIGVSASIIQYMLENGADLNATNKYGQTPLYKALISNGLDIVRFLIQKGARLDARSTFDAKELDKESKLHIDLMNSLLKTKHNMMPTEKRGMSLLETAVMESKEDVAKYLLSLGAELNPANSEWTPLHVATMMNDITMMEYVIRLGANASGTNSAGWTPLHTAAWGGNLEGIRFIIKQNVSISPKDHFGWTPLHIATKHSKLASVKELLVAGCDVNAPDLLGLSPLSWVEAGGHPEFLQLFLNKTGNNTQTDSKLGKNNYSKHTQIIKLLLENRSAIDQQDSSIGWSTLHWAAANGHMRSVKLLVESGAAINIKSKTGKTPMNLSRTWGREKVYNYLNSKGGVL